MSPPGSSVILTSRLDPSLDVRDVGPSAWDVSLSGQECDWGLQEDGLKMPYNPSPTQGLIILDRGASLSSTSCYSTLSKMNTGVTLRSKDYILAVPELHPSFGANDSNLAFPSPAQEPSWHTILSREDRLDSPLTMGHISHASNDVFGYPSPLAPSSTLCTILPYPLTTSSNQDAEESCRTPGSDEFSPLDALPRCLESYDFIAFLNDIPSSDIAAWMDKPLDFGEMVDVEGLPLSTDFPLEQHLIASEEAVRHCEWIDENGAVCGAELSRSTLSGHLSTHGIKSMSRDRPTKCQWATCKRKKPINRESIVRHVREVHLRLRRPPRQVPEPRS